jgi:putative ABC transport system permease protein
MESLLRDLRFAGKALWKNPGYALIAILTLSLGIGANTAVFSVVNAMLLRALPYPQAEQLMYIWNADPERPDERSSVSPHRFASAQPELRLVFCLSLYQLCLDRQRAAAIVERHYGVQ